MNKFIVSANETNTNITFDRNKRFFIDNNLQQAVISTQIDGIFRIEKDNKIYEALLVKKEKSTLVFLIEGRYYFVSVKDELESITDEILSHSHLITNEIEIEAPMPGMILDISVKEGDSVEQGTNLFVLEAMKMENIIRSPRKGTIKKIMKKVGDPVDKNEFIMLIHV